MVGIHRDLVAGAAAVLLAVGPACGQTSAPTARTFGAIPSYAVRSVVPSLGPRRLRPRIGVVLSGGSAKGLAHIGVLRVLHDAGVPVDVITGTSMGGLVGGLYAIGYSPDDLAHLATTLDWSALFEDAPDPRLDPMSRTDLSARALITLPLTRGKLGLPQSLIAGQRISELLARLTWPAQLVRDFRQLPIPFATVATDIATGDPVLLDSGSLASAMEASMALPTVFSPVERHGRKLIDGGWSRNLPAQEARDLGADIVICSDVSDPLYQAKDIHDLVDVLLQTITFQTLASSEAQRHLCDIYVRPDPAGMSAFSFNHADEWIQRGDSAARLLLPRLVALADSVERLASTGSPGPARQPLPTNNVAVPVPVLVHGVRIVAPSAVAERSIRRMLRLRTGLVNPDRLERAMERVYASGMFARVWYELAPDDSGTVVVVHVEPRAENRVGFGFRYDERYNASLLFTATLRNSLGYGSETRFDLRLGEQVHLGISAVRGGLLGSRFTVGTTASYTNAPFDLFRGGQRIDESNVSDASLTVLGGVQLADRGGLALELGGERVSGHSVFASVDTSGMRAFATASGSFWWSALDREDFPHQGLAFFARSRLGFGGGAPFVHHFADLRSAIPVTRTVTLLARATAGATLGAINVPISYRFFLGGANPSGVLPETQLPLLGLLPQERLGDAVARLESGVQWEAIPNVFAIARVDVGNVAPALRHTLDHPILGAGLTMGTQTFIGPIRLTASGRTLRTWPDFSVSIGYEF